MQNIQEKAVELFNQGYSCSESVIRAAYECGMIKQDIDIEILNQLASPFSGGIGESGCLCGAIAGSHLVLGLTFGRRDLNSSPKEMKRIAREYNQKFKEIRKATCCKALSAGYDFHSPERRQNCTNIVADAAKILDEHIKINTSKLESV